MPTFNYRVRLAADGISARGMTMRTFSVGSFDEEHGFDQYADVARLLRQRWPNCDGEVVDVNGHNAIAVWPTPQHVGRPIAIVDWYET